MIELRNINFRYAGGTDAGGLVNIDLIIPDGQVILLCGQSGCGKTTLTRLVNGLIPNYYEGKLSGEVLLDGKNISRLPLYETAKYVGSVFQNPRTQFFTVDSTSELAFGCENQGLPKEEIIQRVKSTAKQFDMDNLLGKNIFSLSGGEKQKIACASVSASNPPIIVLDEPSSNLDMSATKDLRRMIQIWKQQGKTVIIAEHRLYYLKELIDRVVYLKDGKIEKDYSALDALKLSVTQQAEMGLRPFDLGAFPVTAHPVASRSSIECENFHFAYTKQRDALDIDSLSLPQAGVIAVIGHNGAGKSTLARCLCGLEKHCKGIVKVDGKPYNRKQRLSLCYMVMQDVNHQLFTESTEEEMLISMAEPATDKADAVLDRLDLLQFIKAFNQSSSSYEKFTKAVQSFKDYTLKWYQSTWKLMNFISAVLPSTFLGTLPIGMYLYWTGSLAPQDLVMCLILSLGIVGPLMNFTTYVNETKTVEYAVHDVDKLLHVEELPDTGKPVEVQSKDIQLQDVSFSYDKESGKQVLSHINLKIPEGKFTALVGPSGGGKSTIARLIARFWDVNDGKITIGGVDIRSMPLAQLADIVSFVAQDNFLFNCSIKENIRLGNPDATDEEVYAAAKAACCDEFIQKLDNGYDTMAGDAGNRLSGGEKQRISIARMILKNAPIVILDEATAFTDQENEEKIQQSIAALTKGKTLLVIAHRLSTIKNADQIIVLQNGQVENTGTHQQLLAGDALYRDMWEAHIGAQNWSAGSGKGGN